jgi:hypothetical protein
VNLSNARKEKRPPPTNDGKFPAIQTHGRIPLASKMPKQEIHHQQWLPLNL